MKVQLMLELGDSWEMYRGADSKQLFLELMDSNFEDAGIVECKVIE